MILKFSIRSLIIITAVSSVALSSVAMLKDDNAAVKVPPGSESCVPLVTMEKVANSLINNLKQNQARLKQNPKAVDDIVNKVLVPEVDARSMAASVVGPQWRSMSDKQKQEFSDAFLKLVVKSYSGALNDYSDQRIVFAPMRSCSDQGEQTVNSKILSGSAQPVAVEYKLNCKKTASTSVCKVYDLIVEGVSMLQNYRSQVRALLGQGKTIDQITVMLQKQSDK